MSVFCTPRILPAAILAMSLLPFAVAQTTQTAPEPPPTHGTPQTHPMAATAAAKPPVHHRKKKPVAASSTADAVHGTPQTEGHGTPQSTQPK